MPTCSSSKRWWHSIPGGLWPFRWSNITPLQRWFSVVARWSGWKGVKILLIFQTPAFTTTEMIYMHLDIHNPWIGWVFLLSTAWTDWRDFWSVNRVDAAQQQPQTPAATKTCAVWLIWAIMLPSIVGIWSPVGNSAKQPTISVEVFARCLPGIGSRWLNRLWVKCCRNLWRHMTSNIRQWYRHTHYTWSIQNGALHFWQAILLCPIFQFSQGTLPTAMGNHVLYCMITCHFPLSKYIYIYTHL